MKKVIKKTLKRLKSLLSKKIAVPYPILEGNLLQGRVALITGGSSGIGYSIAESFLKNGCSCIIVGRNENKLNEAKRKLQKYTSKGNFVEYSVLDISKVEIIEEKFNNIIQKFNIQIDIFVNNAGIQMGSSIGKTKIEDFEKVIKTNIEGTFFMSQVIINYMIKNKIKGNILNVLSSSSIRPAVNPYAISKWGEAGLALGMAKKCIEYGIVVNSIAPGPTATPMLISNEKNKDITNKNAPTGRYIMPEEIANMSTVLVSDIGKMIVGDTIYMTGGAGVITYDDIEY